MHFHYKKCAWIANIPPPPPQNVDLECEPSVFSRIAYSQDDPEDEAVDCVWRKQHLQYRQENKLGATKPWSEAGMGMGGVRSAREKDLVEIVAGKVRAEAFSSTSDLVADLSQSIARAPFSKGVRCLTTSSQLFAFKLQRLLTPQEYWSIMGLPKHARSNFVCEAAKDAGSRINGVACGGLHYLGPCH